MRLSLVHNLLAKQSLLTWQVDVEFALSADRTCLCDSLLLTSYLLRDTTRWLSTNIHRERTSYRQETKGKLRHIPSFICCTTDLFPLTMHATNNKTTQQPIDIQNEIMILADSNPSILQVQLLTTTVQSKQSLRRACYVWHDMYIANLESLTFKIRTEFILTHWPF